MISYDDKDDEEGEEEEDEERRVVTNNVYTRYQVFYTQNLYKRRYVSTEFYSLFKDNICNTNLLLHKPTVFL